METLLGQLKIECTPPKHTNSASTGGSVRIGSFQTCSSGWREESDRDYERLVAEAKEIKRRYDTYGQLLFALEAAEGRLDSDDDSGGAIATRRIVSNAIAKANGDSGHCPACSNGFPLEDAACRTCGRSRGA